MDLLKKTIILTSSDVKYGGMGVLTLIKSGSGVFGNFKTYNVKSCSNMILGILINGKTIKEKVFINEINNFKLGDDLDINGQISCVLVDKQPEKLVPIVWFSGTKEVNKFTIMNVIYKDETARINNVNKQNQDCIGQLDNKKQYENALNITSDFTPNNKDMDFVEGFKLLKDCGNNDNIQQDDDNKCHISQKYNKLNNGIDNKVDEFKFKEKVFEYTDEEIEEEIDRSLEKTFYDLIESQIEDLFAKYPSEKFLESLIENSKWVKIDFENNGRYYVLGLIYQNSNVKYVCYGVPGRYDTLPPKEIEDYNQWIPIESGNVGGEGYWIMYQDALTGESIKLNVV